MSDVYRRTDTIAQTVAISALLYAGLALLAFGSVSLVYPPRFLGIATRAGALIVFAAGFLAVVAALAVPPPAVRTRFAALSAPGYAKAAMNFRVEPGENGFSLVTTETRVFSTDPKTARAFAVYWRFIYPGSAPSSGGCGSMRSPSGPSVPSVSRGETRLAYFALMTTPASARDLLRHALATLACRAGKALRGESYFRSDIAIGRVGRDQSAPHREFD